MAETPLFSRQVEKLFDEDTKQSLIEFLVENPLSGDEIPETGGVRKLRYAASGRGKSGGARVIYYYLDDDFPIYLLLVYPKNAKINLTSEEKTAARKLVRKLKDTRKKRK